MQAGFCLHHPGIAGPWSGLWLQTEAACGLCYRSQPSSPDLVLVCQRGVLSLFSGFQCLFCSKIRERMVSCSKA